MEQTMSVKKSWFYKLSLAAGVFGMVVISAVLIDGEPAKPRHVGVVDDWSLHHLVFSNPGAQEQAIANGAYSQWLRPQFDTRFITKPRYFTVASSAIRSYRLSPTTLTFRQSFLVTSPAQTVTLQNTGNEPLTITSLAVSGTNASDFALTTTGTSCPYGGGSLPAGDSCTISVTFFPTTTGTEETAAVTVNAASSPQTVILNGTGAVSGNQFMTLDSTKTYLVNTFTNQPVFITGDVPQFAMVQVSNADVQTYLADRASRGFNALWIYPVDKVDQTNAPKNYYGYSPFDAADFTSEDATYWAYVDRVVQQAAAYGFTLFMDPGFVGLNSSSGYLQSYLNTSDATLTAYGVWLGTRYKNYPNIIWSIGGDADPNDTALYTKLSDLAKGIKSVDTVHLMTLEAARLLEGGKAGPNGGYSSLDAEGLDSSVGAWLNLNWAYNTYSTTQAGCSRNYTRPGAMATLMGEDWYELEHSMTALKSREETYWEVLSGCTLGRLFGNQALYAFNGPLNVSGQTWQSQLGSPGSLAEEYEGQLMRSREFWKMQPDTGNAVLTGGIGSGTSISVASCTSDGKTCIVYDPIGTAQPPEIAMTHFSGPIHAWWFNPSTAATTDLGTFPNTGTQTFTPPDGNDWVLVLDLNSAGWAAPGNRPTYRR